MVRANPPCSASSMVIILKPMDMTLHCLGIKEDGVKVYGISSRKLALYRPKCIGILIKRRLYGIPLLRDFTTVLGGLLTSSIKRRSRLKSCWNFLTLHRIEIKNCTHCP